MTTQQEPSRAEAIEKALRDLLGQVGNIEVLGEYSAMDTNLASQKRMRAVIDGIVSAARAALALPSDLPRALPLVGWMLIASAPKDGTTVDLWCVTKHGATDRMIDCRWSNNEWRSQDGYIIGHVATHWQPLPAPPIAQEADK